MKKNDASALRSRIRSLKQKLGHVLDELVSQRQGLIRGYWGTRARRCGNPTCRCTRGELHVSKYLSASVDGVTRLVHVPARDEVKVAQCVRRYQRWRGLHGDVGALGAELLAVINKLGEALLESYPPDNPLPAAQKRGRKPKASKP